MTDQPKWTPGPWRATTHDHPEQGVYAGYRIAKMTGGEIQRDRANAHLISAAPDLYAALDAAMAFIESHVADPDITDVMIRNYRTLQDLRPRDVLAKARGETK